MASTDQTPLPGLPAPETADVRAGAPNFFSHTCLFRRVLRCDLGAFRLASFLVADESSSIDEWVMASAALEKIIVDLRLSIYELGGMAGEW